MWNYTHTNIASAGNGVSSLLKRIESRRCALSRANPTLSPVMGLGDRIRIKCTEEIQLTVFCVRKFKKQDKRVIRNVKDEEYCHFHSTLAINLAFEDLNCIAARELIREFLYAYLDTLG